MDFPLASPVRCREHGKAELGTMPRCCGASPPTGPKRAAVLPTVKVRAGELRVCGTAGATADLDGERFESRRASCQAGTRGLVCRA
jgi:hypothetical protein